MFEVKNKNTRVTWRRSGVLIVDFENTSHFSCVSIVDDLEQVSVSWVFEF